MGTAECRRKKDHLWMETSESYWAWTNSLFSCVHIGTKISCQQKSLVCKAFFEI